MREYFNSKEIKRLMDENKAASILDLESKLRRPGQLARSRSASCSSNGNWPDSWLNEQHEERQATGHARANADVLQEHAADWDSPARVRWEQLTAKFANFDSKQEALSKPGAVGQRRDLRGVPFADVAKAHSQDVSAEEGGVHDWASKDSLRSDDARRGVVRAARRRAEPDHRRRRWLSHRARHRARRRQASSVHRSASRNQESLAGRRQGTSQMEYLAKLREHTPVWTRSSTHGFRGPHEPARGARPCARRSSPLAASRLAACSRRRSA